MITASVSHSPIVVALSVAENQVQQRITTKVLTDQIKNDANLTLQIVTGAPSLNEQKGVNSNTQRTIDCRI